MELISPNWTANITKEEQSRSQDFVSGGGAVAFLRGLHACKKLKLLGLQMVLGLRFGAGAAISGAGAGAPAAPALATDLQSDASYITIIATLYSAHSVA